MDVFEVNERNSPATSQHDILVFLWRNLNTFTGTNDTLYFSAALDATVMGERKAKTRLTRNVVVDDWKPCLRLFPS